MGKGVRHCVDDWAVRDRAKVAATMRGCISRNRGLIYIRTMSGRLGLLNGLDLDA